MSKSSEAGAPLGRDTHPARVVGARTSGTTQRGVLSMKEYQGGVI